MAGVVHVYINSDYWNINNKMNEYLLTLEQPYQNISRMS